MANDERGSEGMLRDAARLEKYRPQYLKAAAAASEEGATPPDFATWVAERARKEAAKPGAMQRLRQFIAQ